MLSSISDPIYNHFIFHSNRLMAWEQPIYMHLSTTTTKDAMTDPQKNILKKQSI